MSGTGSTLWPGVDPFPDSHNRDVTTIENLKTESVKKKPGVLVVDDLNENRRMLIRVLRTLDVEIYEAASGEEALEIAAREPELFVALLDVRMPGMDGYALAEALRRLPQSASLPIIFISAHASDTYDHHRAYETGAVDFLIKPISPRILLSKVRVFLNIYQQTSELKAVYSVVSRQTVRLETSAEVMHQIASILSLDELLVEILNLTRDRFSYDLVGIWLLDEENNNIVMRAGQYGTPAPVWEPGYAIPLDAERSIIAHVCRTGLPYLSNDVRSDAHYLPAEELPNVRAELALPLRFSTTLLGALDIQSEMTNAFSAEDVTTFSTLADQIAVAIRNARLYAEVKHLNEDLEAEVEARTKELETAYQNLALLDQNKSDFITVVSHELRTPLTLIHGFSHMLLKNPGITEDAERSEQVEGIVKGAHRMHTIVDHMLDIVSIDSRNLHLDTQSISLVSLLSTLAAGLRGVLEERHLTLTLEDLSTLPEIEGDLEALTKMFNELLTNAIKYTPDGGQIRVEGRVLERPDQKAERYVEITISDTGIGIAPESLELIFAKFYRTGEVTLYSSGRTKFKGGGPGLGLAVVRGIAEAHGGQVWAESPGYDEETLPGSTFHVVLPVEVQRQDMPSSDNLFSLDDHSWHDSDTPWVPDSSPQPGPE